MSRNFHPLIKFDNDLKTFSINKSQDTFFLIFSVTALSLKYATKKKVSEEKNINIHLI